MIQELVNGNWLTVGETKERNLIVPIVSESSKETTIRVLAKNEMCVGVAETLIAKLIRAPERPSSLSALEIRSRSFQLAWENNIVAQDSIVTDFTVEVSRDNGQTWQSVKSGVS
ncbi:MAG: fibronectin type III domain-containing protein, partial [Micrococcales bacterium]|nr:fibronectin type III domain-containing protein [Micrococcales bacterium]